MRTICTVLLALLAIGLCRGASVTTTKSSSTTTSVATTAVAETNSTNDSNCTALSVCYEDSECGSGICLGVFVGTCNCGACLNLLPCQDDSGCGGLKGACNSTTGLCNCIEGYQANGFPTLLKALTGLCNTKQCTNETSDEQCFGLPCNAGRCVCEKTARDADGVALEDSTASSDAKADATTDSTPVATVAARAADDASNTTDKATTSAATTTESSLATTTVDTAVSTNSSGNDTCKALADCYGDDDCGSGRCLGVFVGTCNCNACLNFLSCDNDTACGGLQGACNNTTSRCSCTEGYKANGFPTLLKALNGLCNTKKCTKEDADKECFGLPCHSGRCIC